MPRNTKRLDPLAQLAVNALEDLKGQNILVLDVEKLTTVTDTMIICTGTSSRHVKALAQNVGEDAKKAGYPPLGIEGLDMGEWVLVDLGGVVVHVMQAQARVFYQLEKLWTVEAPIEEAFEAKPKRAAPRKTARKSDAARPAGKAVKKTARKTASKAASTRAAKPAAAPKSAAKKAAPRKKTAARA